MCMHVCASTNVHVAECVFISVCSYMYSCMLMSVSVRNSMQAHMRTPHHMHVFDAIFLFFLFKHIKSCTLSGTSNNLLFFLRIVLVFTSICSTYTL